MEAENQRGNSCEESRTRKVAMEAAENPGKRIYPVMQQEFEDHANASPLVLKIM